MSVTSRQLKIVGSFLFAILVAVILLGVLVRLGDSLAYLAAAFGLIVGWAVGILLAPYQSEQERFRTYAKIGAAFVTGWAVSKVDRVLDLYLDPARGPLILEPLIGHRVLTGMTAFMLAMVTTYVARKYVSFGPSAENPPERQGGLQE